MITVEEYTIWIDTGNEDKNGDTIYNESRIYLCGTCFQRGWKGGILDEYEHIQHSPAERCEICEKMEGE